MRRTKNKPTALDLFSGAGGMSLGFEQAGFSVVGAIDADQAHADGYQTNFPHTPTLCADITKLSATEIRNHFNLAGHRLDVIFGGPPCQGFSAAGKRRVNDPRNRCVADFARIVTALRPRFFVLENVSGLLSLAGGAVLNEFVESVQGNGYSVVQPIQLLNAANFGVPQSRKRLFVIGALKGNPTPHYPQGSARLPTVREALSDLPNVDSFPHLLHSDLYSGRLGKPSWYASILRGEKLDDDDFSGRSGERTQTLTGCRRTVHSRIVKQRFERVACGARESISRFARLDPDGVAPTLRAGTTVATGKFTAVRPIHYRFPRCITVREAARLHSIPDWFVVDPTTWYGFMQVGNSVPPLLARAIAKSILKVC